MDTHADSGPNLLLDWHEQGESPRWLKAGAGSVAAHVVLAGILALLASLPAPTPAPEHEIAANIRKAIPLIAPPMKMTQKEPNRGKVSKEVNVEGLLEHRATKETLPSAPAQRQFRAPLPGAPSPVIPTPRLTEPPKIDAQVNTSPALPPAAGAPNVPPPRIQSEEKPKLAFESPGQNGTSTQKNPAFGNIAPPKSSVDEAIRSVARGAGGQGGTVVGDADPAPSLRESLRSPQTPGQTRSSLELLSDPQGIDFKPYLIRILSMVRRNWLAVIPESAHLGRRGQVLLQFVINRDGQVPKLVIAMPSGAEALDRAAVAGISASVPFPPLPAEFKGRDVRLQFSFKYNVQ